MKKRLKLVFLIAFVLIFTSDSLGRKKEKPKKFNPNLYLTPALRYSLVGKGLALRYEPQLVSMAVQINDELACDRFELVNTSLSPMASIGFFASPTLGASIRFLGVIARVNIKLTYFPDTDAGRLGSALDAFGKDLLRILGNTLSNIPDPSVRGAVLILIYSKAQLSDPNYFQQAEAVVIFISREVLAEFNAFRIRFNQLFNMSEIYSFKGEHQIQIMLNEFLQG